MSTKLMIAMEDSVLMIESSRTGWKKIHECLKGTYPQCIISLVQNMVKERRNRAMNKGPLLLRCTFLANTFV